MESKINSLLPEMPVVQPSLVAQVATVVAEGERRTKARRKPKPYEQLKTSTAVLKERKAERKAAKVAKKAGVVKPIARKASKPAGKLSKAAMKVAKRKVEVKKAQTGKSASKTGICSFCGKPLSRHSSVENGMGDVCASKKALLKGKSLEDHMASMTVYDEPGDKYISVKKAIEIARKKGISGYRVLIAMGGDRMLRKPFNSHFQVVIYKGQRYLPKSFQNHLKDIEPK